MGACISPESLLGGGGGGANRPWTRFAHRFFYPASRALSILLEKSGGGPPPDFSRRIERALLAGYDFFGYNSTSHKLIFA